MRVDGRFGGHFVQGHVDGTGRLERMEVGAAGRAGREPTGFRALS